jgi:hypothetical protein
MDKKTAIKFAIGMGIAAGLALTLDSGVKYYKKKTEISDSMFAQAASKLGVDQAFLRALAEKEGAGQGFYINGEPKVRMENKVMDKYYSSKGVPFDAASTYGPNKAGIQEWYRFSNALSKDRQAAIYSTSFGAFQIMGFNALDLGYKSYEEFFQKMSSSADDQFDAMVRFIQKKNLVPYIKAKDYVGFALKYNGSASYALGPDGLQALHTKWIQRVG